MLSELALRIICKKYNISCVLFDKELKIVEYSENVSNFASNDSLMQVGLDIRESFWEFVGFENKLEVLYSGKRDYVHIPMLSQNELFYDINVETCFIDKEEKLYIAMFTRQSSFSMGYLNTIQKINQETLHYENKSEAIKINEKYYNLINQKLISFHIDAEGFIIEVNNACSSFFGFDQKDMLGHHFSEFFFSREGESHSSNISTILRAVDLNGLDVFFHTDIVPINSDKNCNDNIIICQDITYLKRIESELEYAVNHDSLTGLANRNYLAKKLTKYISKNKDEQVVFALCFIDLDKFKNINDEVGHHAGDMYLKHVGEVLSSQLREDDLIARIGGDEFIIILECNENLDYVNKTISRIEYEIENKPLIYNKDIKLPLKLSMGLGFYPENGKDLTELLAYADNQMYLRKRNKQ
jgi:diguanylate cyclase (GGDEF)-like protein/PAS domain S-box-containing protein